MQEYLNRLGLSVTDQIIDGYLESHRDKQLMEIRDHLLEQEANSMRSRKVEMRLEYSGIPFRRTMDQLMTMGFIHNNGNLLFLGPPGVGKTHL